VATIPFNQCSVTIEGLEPGILLHSPLGMGGTKSTKKTIPTAEDEAASYLYWTKDKKSIALPGENMRRALVEASKGLKSPQNRKIALGPLVAGGIDITPLMIPFGTKEYEVDSRRVVIQRQGVVRSRPLIYPWSLTFTVKWETGDLGKGTDFTDIVLRTLLERIGTSIGIGDFRPARGGRFGRFVVKEINIEK
jgi:hypothetical protein